jgi:hypothetical protein
MNESLAESELTDRHHLELVEKVGMFRQRGVGDIIEVEIYRP